MAEKKASDGAGSSIDDVIDMYKRDVDRTLLRENLKLTPTERLRNLQEMQRFAEELQRAGKTGHKARD